MKPRKTKEMLNVLERKGFVASNRDHIFLFLHINGKKTSVYTKVSHGFKEYGGNLLSLVARQLHLSFGEFEQLLDCAMTGDNYVNLLLKKGVVKY